MNTSGLSATKGFFQGCGAREPSQTKVEVQPRRFLQRTQLIEITFCTGEGFPLAQEVQFVSRRGEVRQQSSRMTGPRVKGLGSLRLASVAAVPVPASPPSTAARSPETRTCRSCRCCTGVAANAGRPASRKNSIAAAAMRLVSDQDITNSRRGSSPAQNTRLPVALVNPAAGPPPFDHSLGAQSQPRPDSHLHIPSAYTANGEYG